MAFGARDKGRMEDPNAQKRALAEANKRVMQESFLMKRATVRNNDRAQSLFCVISESAPTLDKTEPLFCTDLFSRGTISLILTPTPQKADSCG